jgi:site-specific DNA recombinase
VRDKTHRGLDSLARRGLSTGGRTYGYKSVPIDGHPTAKRLVVDQAEADVVRRIFREYADGRSLRAIGRALNAGGIPFPAKDTKRGPARKGWSRISVRFILRNERYVGRVTWNRRQFLKDPDTGKRRSILRPNSEWVTKDYPELRIVSAALWQKTADRIQLVEGQYAKATNAMFRTREARVLYSPHLLSGILTCGSCGARMQVFSTTKGKGGRKYTQSWLRCALAHDKGPAVCTHGTPYREDLLEADLVEHFRAAMNSEHVDRLVMLMNEAIAAELARDDRSPQDIAAEIAKLVAEAQYLVRFLASGGNFETVRSELRAIEEQIAAKTAEHEAAVERSGNGLTKVHKSRVLARLEHLHELLHRDPVRAKAEIARHLDGQLSIRPLPSNTNQRRYEISGAVRPGGLLSIYSEETAGRLQIIAGARLSFTDTGAATAYAIDTQPMGFTVPPCQCREWPWLPSILATRPSPRKWGVW